MFKDYIQRAVLPAAKVAELDSSGDTLASRQTRGRALLSSIVGAVSLAAAVSASMPALAQDKQTADVRVDYSDLDLSDPAAVRVLDRRLALAIRVSCPNDERAAHNLARQRPVIECRAQKRAEISSQREAALASAAGKQNTLAAR
jgi:UrcA family protein